MAFAVSRNRSRMSDRATTTAGPGSVSKTRRTGSSRPPMPSGWISRLGREDPVRLVFDTDPGPAVVVALSDMRDRFRLTANAIDVVPPDQPLPNLPVARAVWK